MIMLKFRYKRRGLSKFFIWRPEIVEHLAECDVTPDEFEEVVSNPDLEDNSRTTGNPIAFGSTSNGKYLCCVYRHVDQDMIEPIPHVKLVNEMQLTPEQMKQARQARARDERSTAWFLWRHPSSNRFVALTS